MQNVISYKHMHECGCKILDIDSLFVTYGCFALDTWFELESDIIVVILKKKDLLSRMPFRLSTIYERKLWVLALLLFIPKFYIIIDLI
jgi:hypothetical protein